jgi:hypothetical protein
MFHITPDGTVTHRRGGCVTMCSRIPSKRDLPDDVVAQIKRKTPRLHDLGQVALSEFICELAAGADVMARLEAYSNLHSTFVRNNSGTLLPDSIDKLTK